MNQVQIKICGITRVEDARASAELGADMIGLNFYRASSRYIEPQRAREIVGAIPSRLRCIGVFVDADSEEIRDVIRTTGISAIQLHGKATQEMCTALAREVRIIRALATDEQFDPAAVRDWPNCDLLLDAHHPQLRGGTGTTCDWPAARAARAFTRFLMLSGGLNSENVRDAIAIVAPDAVDVCSGVESAPGVKDHDAIERFVNAVRAAK
jgi:phosphoribosylanthranilate isomerase